MNKTAKQSSMLVCILACLVAFGPLSIDMYLPSLPAIATGLHASNSSIKQTITVFLIGFSLGMLVYGPLSDHYGRRKLLLTGIVLYLLATIACIWAQSADALLIARFLQALGGASASVLARAIVRDVYDIKDAAKILSWMQIITMVATISAPILGSWLVMLWGWRAIFVFLFLFALMCLIVFSKQVPETLLPEKRSPSIKAVFYAYFQIGTSKEGLAYILCMGMAFAGMFVYITASPFVYIKHFGVSAEQYAYLFGLNIFGIMLMTFVNASVVTRFGPQRMIQFGASILLLASLALLVMGNTGWGGLWGIVVGLWFFVAMTGSLSANCIALLMGLFSKQAGAAAGLAVAMQFGLGALFSFLVSQFKVTSPEPMVGLMALAAVIGFMSMLVTRAQYLKHQYA